MKHRLTPILQELYKEVLKVGKFHLSARRGIILLIEKTGKDPLFLEKWRPLTLLNCDYKILFKILAVRMNIVMPDIIDPIQSGFMKNSTIAQNIQLTNTIDHCNKMERPAIKEILKRFNFGEYFISAVFTLYNDPVSCVMNNGYISEWFTLSRSCRQGPL